MVWKGGINITLLFRWLETLISISVCLSDQIIYSFCLLEFLLQNRTAFLLFSLLFYKQWHHVRKGQNLFYIRHEISS